MDKDTVRQAYDELATVHASQRIKDGSDIEVLRRFLGSLSDSPFVLDAGCGQGTPVLAKLSATAAALGVDFSHEQLQLAATNAPAASLVQGDMTALPIASSVVDGVVAYWSLIHVPLADHQRVLDEFARVLRPDGRLLLCEGTNEWTGRNPDWLDSGVQMERNIAGSKATRRHLREAGFVVTEQWGEESSLEADRDSEAEDDTPWMFFSAQLED